MPQSYAYVRDSEGGIQIAVTDSVVNGSGTLFQNLGPYVFNSVGVAYTIFNTRISLPPFIPDLDNEVEVERAINAGRYFIVPETQRYFEITFEDGNRIFEA